MRSKQPPRPRPIVAILVAAATALAGCTAREDEELAKLNGHSYELVYRPNGITWNQAKAEAERRTHRGAKGYLVAVTSQAEMDFIIASLFPPPEQRVYSTAIWAGGYRDPDSGGRNVGWTWINGDPWGYTNWNRHQPDGMGGAPENVLSIGVNPGGKWNDLPPEGHVEKHYIVEFDGPSRD